MYKRAGWWDDLKAGFQAMLGTRHTDRSAERHFKAKKPNWDKFDKALSRPAFRKAILQDPRADKKLRKFTAMQGRIRDYDGPVVKVMGSNGDKSYDVQYHKDIKRYTCTCDDFKYKKAITGGDCKHIKRVKREGGMKISTIRSFGAEYAKILDQDPEYRWLVDSAQTRALRQERDQEYQDESLVEGRLRTSGDEPPIPVVRTGRSGTGEDPGIMDLDTLTPAPNVRSYSCK